jgi:glycerate dehydrogenase
MDIVLLDRKTLGNDLDLSPLWEFGEVTTFATTSSFETMKRIEEVDVIITNKVVITREQMEQASNLKLICIAATGMNNIDLEAANELGIAVKNVSGYSTTSVVQHTFTLALSLIGRLNYYQESVKSGNWSQKELFTDVTQPFCEIAGKKWGIIGLGTIGKEVARVAEAFGADIEYYSTSGENKINDYHHCELEELFKTCDIISIHSPLNKKTKNLINASNLGYLKDRAVLLNLGRGGIINEKDLADELNRREIYVGLDVLESEPIDMENPLLHLDSPNRVTITPHIAWASVEARQKLLEGVVENIETFLKQECF